MPNLSIKLHHSFVCIRKKLTVYKDWYYLWFQASTGGSWHIHPVDMGGLLYGLGA